MQILTKNGVDVTGIYIMALEGSITPEEFNNKVQEINNK